MNLEFLEFLEAWVYEDFKKLNPEFSETWVYRILKNEFTIFGIFENLEREF